MTKRLKIAVNTRFLLPNKREGIGTYTHEVLQRLIPLMPEVEFHFLFDRAFDNQFIYTDNVTGHVLSPPARHPILWYYWFEHAVHKWLKNNQVDLFFSLDSFLSLKTTTPTLLVMHDIGFEHFKGHNNLLAQMFYKQFFPKYAKKAKHIMAVSNYTKNDICSLYQINPEKISLAPCGVSEAYYPLSPNERTIIKTKLTGGVSYYVCVGSINPRKNMSNIIKAFDQLKLKHKLPHKLVIVGAMGWKTKNFVDTLKSCKHINDIVLTGHLDPVELNKVLNAAEALVFTSLFEGFGIPIVEAFSSGTAVVTSNNSSMPEIAGDAAKIVDPTDVGAISKAMFELSDREEQDKYTNKGFEQAKKYTWQSTAKKTAEVINTLLKRKNEI